MFKRQKLSEFSVSMPIDGLRCVGCGHFPDHNVMQCIDGHLMCGRCYGAHNATCPLCQYKCNQGPMMFNNLAMSLLQKVVRPCKYMLCREDPMLHDMMKRHEEQCMFRPMACPTCSELFESAEVLVEHLTGSPANGCGVVKDWCAFDKEVAQAVQDNSQRIVRLLIPKIRYTPAALVQFFGCLDKADITYVPSRSWMSVTLISYANLDCDALIETTGKDPVTIPAQNWSTIWNTRYAQSAALWLDRKEVLEQATKFKVKLFMREEE